MPRPLNTLRGIGRELSWIARSAADVPSLARYAADVFLFRLMRVCRRLPGQNRERSIRLRGNTTLTYRLNRGDIESIREVWVEESYRLPFDARTDVVVDLGANIGLTSLWLNRRYQCSLIVAVEPSPENARLVRENLARNHVAATVVEAAVGPQDGTILFEKSDDSNRGRIGDGERGVSVRMLSMDSVLDLLPNGVSADLVKMDIEGGEQELLCGDLSWLTRVRGMIAEFHPLVVDYPALVATLQKNGFRYIAAGTVRRNSMDAFVKG